MHGYVIAGNLLICHVFIKIISNSFQSIRLTCTHWIYARAQYIITLPQRQTKLANSDGSSHQSKLFHITKNRSWNTLYCSTVIAPCSMTECHLSSWLMHLVLIFSRFPGDVPSCVTSWTHFDFAHLKKGLHWGTVSTNCACPFLACGPTALFVQASIFWTHH